MIQKYPLIFLIIQMDGLRQQTKWNIFDQSVYRGTAGNNSYFSAITYYEKYYSNASIESKIRSAGVNGDDGFSIILRAQFNENGDFLQGTLSMWKAVILDYKFQAGKYQQHSQTVTIC